MDIKNEYKSQDGSDVKYSGIQGRGEDRTRVFRNKD